MNEKLNEWVRNGWLIEHKTSRQEISELLAVADRDIKDASIEDLSLDAQFSIAYSAIVQCSKVVLAVSGYRVTRESAHYRSIQALAIILDISSDTIKKLNEFRKKRNIVEYDRIGSTTKKEVVEILTLAKEIKEQTKEWIRKKSPELLKHQNYRNHKR
ncbi:MAG: hypothetical protein OEZ20_06600 [candidate division WOR-3 bacterium]|nr:hypothetical protein [candidate division WOR-3 bacterium]MDH5684114.1 hypothetical protein [candidate division WOR-3 bacterium]